MAPRRSILSAFSFRVFSLSPGLLRLQEILKRTNYESCQALGMAIGSLLVPWEVMLDEMV